MLPSPGKSARGAGSPRKKGGGRYTSQAPELPLIEAGGKRRTSVQTWNAAGSRVAMMNRLAKGKSQSSKRLDAGQMAMDWKRERAAQARRFRPRKGTTISNEQRKIAMEAFFAMDKDGSGSIDIEELSTLFKTLGHNAKQDELEKIVMEADDNGDGRIQLREFLDYYADAISNQSAHELELMHMKELLVAMGDSSGDSISKSKLSSVLMEHYDLDIDLDALLVAAFKKGVGELTEAQSMMDDNLTLSELTRVLLDPPPV